VNSKYPIKPLPDVWKILIPLIVLGLGGAGAFYTQGVRTEERVERIQTDNQDAAQDREELHDDLDEVRISVTKLSSDVQNATLQAASREKRTTKAINDLTMAVDSRRWRR
jgi:TolA-binding protein